MRPPGAEGAGAAGGAAAARLLVVFTRWPAPGRAKTRLIPALGAEGAAALQRAMTEHVLARVAPVEAAKEVRFDGGTSGAMRGWLGEGIRLREQGAGDLGERLARACAEGFAGGARAVAVIGTDCPGLEASDLAAAWDQLERHDAVFGPAADGGYWLVGIRRAAWPAAAALFGGVPWGGPDVLHSSEDAAARAGLTTARLRTLADVDRFEDLPVWERARASATVGEPPGAAAGALISVVIPTLNEAERIGPLLAELRRAPGVEVIVSDGGSADGTVTLAEAAGARVIRGPAGRAAQMNAGAAVARGGILLFLHADTRPPEGFARLIRAALVEPGTAGGAFSFVTDSQQRGLWIIAALANWRARRLGVVFGDQGIFAHRQSFEAAGGFPALPVMEDDEFVRRLRGQGRVVVLPEAAISSARRWQARGLWRTSLLNVLVTWAYRLGMSPARLARWYRGRG